jgi:hypothetical protein
VKLEQMHGGSVKDGDDEMPKSAKMKKGMLVGN